MIYEWQAVNRWDDADVSDIYHVGTYLVGKGRQRIGVSLCSPEQEAELK